MATAMAMAGALTTKMFASPKICFPGLATPISAFQSSSLCRTQHILSKRTSVSGRHIVAVATNGSSGAAVVADKSAFADEEASKFREDILQMMDKFEIPADHRIQVADTCTKILRNYVANYSGTVPPEPFGEMKAALESEGIPAANKVIAFAVGWARWNLAHDWKKWSPTST